MNRWAVSFACVLSCVVIPVHDPVHAGTPLTTQLVTDDLDDPVMAKSPPGDFQRLMVVQRGGRVRLVKNGVLQAADFIDITGQVQSHDERGLLDIAFHPNYAANGYFYLRYTNTSGQTQVRRYTRSANPDVGNPATGLSIIRLPCPLGFHIGGTIDFGRDGFLYITVGDCTDTGNAQSLNSLHGKILRVDVNGDAFPGDGDNNYSIPAGNPYAGPTFGRDEIWSVGLRNPYRAAFDRLTGALWIADVGNIGPEEIDFQPLGQGGHNYGWPCMEGANCWPAQTDCSCGQSGIVAPVHDYTHNGGHCAVTGGRVYRGCAIPDLVGTYFFGDYCSADIWSFRYDNGQITEFTSRHNELEPPGDDSINWIVGFGEDAYGEIYICDMSGGELFKIVPDAAAPDANGNGVPDACEHDAGDVDRDGVVNVNDLLAVIMNWGPCFACPADVAPWPTGNGTIDVADLLLVITNWG